MHDRILVRGELSEWVHVGRIAAAILVGSGYWCCVCRVGLGLGGGGRSVVARFGRCCLADPATATWLTLHPDGIEIEDRAGQRAIHDSQVVAAALETKKNLANGELSSITRKFTIWGEDWPEPILMENRIKIGKGDPLAELIERLLNRLQTRMEQDLARGGTASGDGWHLSRSALTIGRAPNEEQMPLSEVAAIESRDGQMCVWRRGVDTAVAKLPLSGRNVYLLPAPGESVSSRGDRAERGHERERRTGAGAVREAGEHKHDFVAGDCRDFVDCFCRGDAGDLSKKASR